MKRILLFINLFSLFFIFSGCPYEADVPIDAPSVKINPKLLGVWKLLDKPNVIYKVIKQNEFTYSIVVNDKAEHYLAYTSLVNGVAFLNIWKNEPEGSTRKYYLFKIETISEGIISLLEVSDNISERFTSEKALKNFISSNMKNSYFFNRKEQSLINETQIIELSKDKVVKEMALGKSRAINYFMLGTLAIVIIASFVLWLFVSNKSKTEKLIFEKKEFSAMLQGQDIERKRIASDLHDRLGSMLSTVKAYFNTLEENIGQLKNENKEQYHKANALLDEACEEVRKISHDLASDVLVRMGLLAALEKLRETVSMTNKINVNLLSFGLEERVESSVEIAVYRIIQEMISNILNHSSATEVTVQLNRHENNLKGISNNPVLKNIFS